MTAPFIWKYKRSSLVALVAGVILISCAGCQTCRLSEEDFQKQQKGQTVDRETGDAVAVVGTVGYYVAMIGEIVASAVGK